MKNDTGNEISPGRAAIIAAIAMLIMTILAPIADVAIIKKLFVPDDAATTLINIVASEGLFRMAILFFLIVAILDVIIAWALYVFLKPVNKDLSLLTAWFRLIYTSLLLVAVFNLLNVIQLVEGASQVLPAQPSQHQAHVMSLIQSFSQTWEFGLIIFGVHLFLLGYLLFKAGYMRNILGILIIIASMGYMVDGCGTILSANYTMSISVFTFIGEVVIIFWLFIRGRKVSQINP